MSSFFPNVNFESDAPAPNITYTETVVSSHGASTTTRRLAVEGTALVLFPNRPSDLHIVQSLAINDKELWPVGTDQEPVIDEMFRQSYPQFTFPSWELYKFWKADKAATDQQIEDNYGSKEEYTTWLANGDEKPVTFSPFNAMLRIFDDQPDANHLEIKQPGGTITSARIPARDYERILNPSHFPSRQAEYASFWLPRLVMDTRASVWFGKIQDERAEAEAKREADREAARVWKNIEQAFGDCDQAA